MSYDFMKRKTWQAMLQFYQTDENPLKCSVIFSLDIPLIGNNFVRKVEIPPMTESESITYLDKFMRSLPDKVHVKITLFYTPKAKTFECLEAFIETFSPNEKTAAMRQHNNRRANERTLQSNKSLEV